jgi:hypothetical protein
VAFYQSGNSITGYLYEKYLNDSNTAPASPMTGGTVTFAIAANVAPGQYNIRFNNTTPTTIVTSATITVTPAPAVTVTPTTTAPGGVVTATVANGPATSRWDWVAFYPVGNPISWYLYEKYLSNSSTAPETPLTGGTITFPLATDLPAGNYNVRVNTAAGTTVATSQTITVASTTISLSSATVAQGGTVTATIANAPAVSRYEWVGFYPEGNSIGGYLYERYLNNSSTAPASPMTGGTVTFSIPTNLASGQYRVRFNNPTPVTLAQSAIVTITDTTAPTISASVSPAANAAGWNNSPVTVTFTCSDNAPGVSCPAAVVVDQDGSGQLVSRTATDAAGNISSSANVTINLDTEPPSIELTTVVPAETIDTSLDVEATVTDSLSGAASATCSGVAAALSGGTVECEMPLKIGRNVVLASVVDAAGNSASDSATTVRVTTAAIELTVTPASASILAGEQRLLRAVDQFGRLPTGVTWSSEDDNVVTVVTDEDGAMFALGIASGTVTLTATLGGETAELELTVHAGAALPAGTPRWTAPQRAGIAGAETVISANFGGDDAIYSVEGGARLMNGLQQATVRALGVDGTENWFGALPVGEDEVVQKIMPHANGGIVAVLHTYSDPAEPAAIVRYTGTGSGSWRYQSGAFDMRAVTGSSGTVFVVETESGPNVSPFVVVLDGDTGAVLARQLLPQFLIKSISTFAVEVDPVGFVVDANGHGRFLISHGEWVAPSPGSGSVSYTLDLYDVAPTGAIAITTLDTVNHSAASSQYWLEPQSLTPDGEGVLALYMRRSGAVQTEGWHGKYYGTTNTAFTLPGPWRPTVSSYDGFGVGRGDTPSDPLTARGLRSGALVWQSAVSGEPVLALKDAGAAIRDTNGDLREISSSGSASAVDGAASDGPFAYGRFHGRDASYTLQATPWRPVDEATISRVIGGYLRTVMGGFGFHAKAYDIPGTFGLEKHLGLAFVPRNQKVWASHPTLANYQISLTKSPKLYGENLVVTTGGAPVGGPPDWKLSQFFNRSPGDLDKPANPGVWLHVAPQLEDQKALDLLLRSYGFPDGVLEYDAVPIVGLPGYNSNSFMRGLLNVCGLLPPPSFFTNATFPGAGKPVPPEYFPIIVP